MRKPEVRKPGMRKPEDEVGVGQRRCLGRTVSYCISAEGKTWADLSDQVAPGKGRWPRYRDLDDSRGTAALS